MEKFRHQYPVGALADAIEVSTSGFHAHRHKPRRSRRQRDAQLRPLIAGSFARSRQTYGPLRVRADLRDLGERCGKNRRGGGGDKRGLAMGEPEGWLFLAFTLDGCSRRCAAHHCREDMRAELVTTTFALACQRQPPPPGLLHLPAPSGAALRAKAPPFGYLAPLGSAIAACNTPPTPSRSSPPRGG